MSRIFDPVRPNSLFRTPHLWRMPSFARNGALLLASRRKVYRSQSHCQISAYARLRLFFSFHSFCCKFFLVVFRTWSVCECRLKKREQCAWWVPSAWQTCGPSWKLCVFVLKLWMQRAYEEKLRLDKNLGFHAWPLLQSSGMIPCTLARSKGLGLAGWHTAVPVYTLANDTWVFPLIPLHDDCLLWVVLNLIREEGREIWGKSWCRPSCTLAPEIMSCIYGFIMLFQIFNYFTAHVEYGSSNRKRVTTQCRLTCTTNAKLEIVECSSLPVLQSICDLWPCTRKLKSGK